MQKNHPDNRQKLYQPWRTVDCPSLTWSKSVWKSVILVDLRYQSHLWPQVTFCKFDPYLLSTRLWIWHMAPSCLINTTDVTRTQSVYIGRQLHEWKWNLSEKNKETAPEFVCQQVRNQRCQLMDPPLPPEACFACSSISKDKANLAEASHYVSWQKDQYLCRKLHFCVLPWRTSAPNGAFVTNGLSTAVVESPRSEVKN